ncbi:MAG: cell division protein FtsA [Patescibacteria group bacterium]
MQNKISVGIDVGNTKIITCIGKFENGTVDIIGVGNSPNQGIRKGVVVDVEETVSAISASLEEAERMAGAAAQFGAIGISGPHIEFEENRGVVAISRADGQIGEADVGRALEAAQAISNRPNREVLHIIPAAYIIDGREEIKDPIGMTGIRLEVVAEVISSSTNAIKSLTRCVDQAGVGVNEVVFSPLATAELLVSKRQREIGALLIDIGSGGTSYAVFEDGNLIFSGVIPIGTMHITNDLAIGLRTNIDIAEIIKIKHGFALPDKVDENEEIDLSKLDKNEQGTAELKYVAEIIEARLNEILLIIKENLGKIGRDGTLPAGVVLTGGGAKIEGVTELTKETLRLPAQIGKPAIEINGLIDKLNDPVYATSIGLMLWGKNKSGGGNSFDFGVNNFNGLLERVRSVLKHFLP